MTLRASRTVLLGVPLLSTVALWEIKHHEPVDEMPERPEIPVERINYSILFLPSSALRYRAVLRPRWCLATSGPTSRSFRTLAMASR